MKEKNACHVGVFRKQVSEEERRIVMTAALEVSGMGCPNCATRVRNSLLYERGVVAADVDHQSGLALVRFNPQLVGVEQLLSAVEAAGNNGRHRYAARFFASASKGR